MKEIVWVFGNGAAGKATLITFTLGQNSTNLRKRLGWQHKKVRACEESLEWLGTHPEDPTISKRLKIPALVAQMAPVSDVILIKGQDVDLQEHRPEKLKSLLKNARHRIIFISTDLDELMDRRRHKAWWKGDETREDTENLLLHQLSMLAPLKSDMEFIVVNGSSGKDYSFTSLPLNLQNLHSTIFARN